MHRFKEQLTTVVAGFQWLSFIFVNTVVIPLSIGTAYELTALEISGNMARSFILTGMACLFQALFGHRLPLMEGQTGLWWGVILSIASIGISSGKSITEVGGSLAVGIMIGGLIILLFGLFGLHKMLNRLFTPVVMAVLLFLLAAQLIDIFFQGMVGITSTGAIDVPVALLSLFLVLLVLVLTIAGRGLLSNFSILIGVIVGWILYAMFWETSSQIVVPRFRDIGEMFVWGEPAFDVGIILAAVCAALINSSNTIATLRAAEPLLNVTVDNRAYRRSFFLTGMFTALAGVFSTVPYAPYTSSIGFLQTTRIYKRAPFILGSIFLIVLGCIPQLVSFFSTMPISVGNAVLFVAYLQLFGAALRNIHGLEFTYRSIYRIALPTLLGLAILATPSSAFSTVPGFLQTILSNGMIVGIFLAILLENLIPWEKLDSMK